MRRRLLTYLYPFAAAVFTRRHMFTLQCEYLNKQGLRLEIEKDVPLLHRFNTTVILLHYGNKQPSEFSIYAIDKSNFRETWMALSIFLWITGANFLQNFHCIICLCNQLSPCHILVKDHKVTKFLFFQTIHLLRRIMDQCTHLGNFEPPVDQSLIIPVTAQCDDYMPRDRVISLTDIWPGCEIRYLNRGHVSSILFNKADFRWVHRLYLLVSWGVTCCSFGNSKAPLDNDSIQV